MDCCTEFIIPPKVFIPLKDAIYICNNFLYLYTGTRDYTIIDMHSMYKPNNTGNQADYTEFIIGTQDNDTTGYVIVSMSQSDTPIKEFSFESSSYYDIFKKMTEKTVFKMIRFGASYYTCEDSDGRLLAQVGDIKIYVPDETEESNQCNSSCMCCCCNKSNNSDLEEINQRYQNIKAQFEDKIFKAEDKRIIDATWMYFLTTLDGTSENVESPEIEVKKIPFHLRIYDMNFAEGSNNQSYFVQILPKTPPNNTDHYSGCAATAWMNLLGWHDLNFTPQLLDGQNIVNNSYIENLTMSMHDNLKTFKKPKDDSGWTYASNMKNGLEVIKKELFFNVNEYEESFKTSANNVNSDSLFKLIEKYVVDKKRPVMILYDSNNFSHFCICYGTAKSRIPGIESYVSVNRALGSLGSDQNFANIPISDLNGVFAVDKFIPFVGITSVDEQQEFVAEPSIVVPNTKTMKANKIIVYNGVALLSFSVDAGSSIFRDTVSFIIGREFTDDKIISINADCTMASISNIGEVNDVVFAADSIRAERDSATNRIKVYMRVAIKGNQTYLNRVFYSVIVYAVGPRE